MSDFVETLESELQKFSDPQKAAELSAYMRDQFDFFGISTILRREIQKPFLIREYLPAKKDLQTIVKLLWLKPQREFQYFSQELVYHYISQPEIYDIQLYEFMAVNKSWWDTVDYISNKLMGQYFITYPDQTHYHIKKWLHSDNIWLQRSALLFQLKYKEDLDKELLSYIIHSLLGSKEFFINKAIGWVLREYSRTDPHWVINFVASNQLDTLSKREALKLINSQY